MASRFGFNRGKGRTPAGVPRGFRQLQTYEDQSALDPNCLGCAGAENVPENMEFEFPSSSWSWLAPTSDTSVESGLIADYSLASYRYTCSTTHIFRSLDVSGFEGTNTLEPTDQAGEVCWWSWWDERAVDVRMHDGFPAAPFAVTPELIEGTTHTLSTHQYATPYSHVDCGTSVSGHPWRCGYVKYGLRADLQIRLATETATDEWTADLNGTKHWRLTLSSVVARAKINVASTFSTGALTADGFNSRAGAAGISPIDTLGVSAATSNSYAGGFVDTSTPPYRVDSVPALTSPNGPTIHYMAEVDCGDLGGDITLRRNLLPSILDPADNWDVTAPTECTIRVQ